MRNSNSYASYGSSSPQGLETFKAAILLLLFTLSCNGASSADLPNFKGERFDRLPWKDVLPHTDPIISPIGPAGWSEEPYSYKFVAYTVAYVSTQAICWPDMKGCLGDEVFCDLTIHGVPETINDRQVLVSKFKNTQECMRRDILSGFESSMHDSVIYKLGIRP